MPHFPRSAFIAVVGVAAVTGLVRVLWPAEVSRPEGTDVRTLRFGGERRGYRLHHPPEWDPHTALPLVLVFHGHHADARTIEYESRMDAVADTARALVVYPEGSGHLDGLPLLGRYWHTWNAGTCCGPATTRPVDDVAFTDSLVHTLVAQGMVDARRVYAAGFSIGGTFALRVACDHADLIAAVADIAGTMPDTACAPARPVPVLFVTGSDDDELRADLRENRGHNAYHFAVSMHNAIGFWAHHDGCTGPVVHVHEPLVEIDSATDCPSSDAVVRVTVRGNDHAWAGGRKAWAFAPDPAPNVPLDERMMAFFVRLSRR